MSRPAVSPGSDSELALRADEQDGVLSRRQLAQLGWNGDRVTNMISSGRWTAYGRRAIVVHRGPLPPRQRRWIAIINGGPYATLAGITAAQEHGLHGFDTDTIHIVLPRDVFAPARQDGVKTHISRRFSLADRHPAKSLPTVRLPRAVVDAAIWSTRPRRACALLIAAVQQRLTTPNQLRYELAIAGRVRHRQLLCRVLDDVQGGSQALSELDLRDLCRRHQLPTPEQQQRRCDAGGRVRYIDAQFRRADGRLLNLEVDGAAHFNVIEAWADMRRDLDVLAQGVPTARIPGAIIRSDPTGVAEHIRTLLNAPW